MEELGLRLIDWLFNLIFIAILGRIILSFVIPLLGRQPNLTLVSIYQALAQVTEPILGPIRRVLPTFGGFDFSPMVAIILLEVIRYIIKSVLV